MKPNQLRINSMCLPALKSGRISMKAILLAAMFLMTLSISGQSDQAQEKFACEKSYRNEVRAFFGQERTGQTEQKLEPGIILASQCEWGGTSSCPASLRKPHYPSAAGKLQQISTIRVAVVVDKTGKVIYAKMLDGNRIFRSSVEQAACASAFRPKNVLGELRIAQYTIQYEFLPVR